MAAAATAERTTYYEDLGLFESKLPLVIVVPEMVTDQLIQVEAAHFIGSVAMGRSVECAAVEKPIDSLYDALKQMIKGDPIADQLVETNIATDVIERTIKVGHVMKPVPLTITEQGKIVQYNQSTDSVQANSLRLARGDDIMQPRTEAETHNAFRIEGLNKEGYFDAGYSLAVFSLAEALPEAGFFTETMSCAIQVTSKKGDGLAVESAFVAGIKEPGGQQHDKGTIIKLYAAFGIDVSGKTNAEIIDMPLLIHNSLIPDGAIDLVKRYDEAAGDTFFGENKPVQDYLEYLQMCRLREASFQPKITKIKAELKAEAPSIATRLMAIERLHKISEKHMVERAVVDHSINPRVFGPAAPHIEKARREYTKGNYDKAQAAITIAQRVAVSDSCPSARKKGLGLGLNAEEDVLGLEEEDEFGSLTFDCPNGHSNRRERGQLIPKCKVCDVSVKCES